MDNEKKPPICVISGDDDGSIVLKPRMVKNAQMQYPKLVVDIRTASGEFVAVSVPMSQMAKIEEFMTFCYDWRRHQLFGTEE
ncbi:MAG: hypothetical protein ACI4SY_02005 [Sutterella sp.]